jgi:hypothetical protein
LNIVILTFFDSRQEDRTTGLNGIVKFDTRQVLVVCFTPRLGYHSGKIPQYPLDRRIAVPSGLTGCCEEQSSCFLRNSNLHPRSSNRVI